MNKTFIALGIFALLLVGGIFYSVDVITDEKPVVVCDAQRLMKGYTGETHCYNYYEDSKRLEIIE